MALRWLLLSALLAACAGLPRGPAALRDGVDLEVRGLPHGSRVLVAGSFNGWGSDGPALVETAPGTFAGRVQLPGGVHRLQLVVRTPDGQERWMPPPGLARYEADGFGGENAVVEITGNLRADGSSFGVK